jgi:hypothetical protein
MNVRNSTTVLRRHHVTIFLEATIVYARQDMRETGKEMEQDAVKFPE